MRLLYSFYLVLFSNALLGSGRIEDDEGLPHFYDICCCDLFPLLITFSDTPRILAGPLSSPLPIYRVLEEKY